VSIGYQPGLGPLRRAHPFTPLAIAGAAAALAFVLPAPRGPLLLSAALVALAAAEGVARAIARPALLTALPFWVFLAVLHGFIGDDPVTALSLGARIFAIIWAFLLALATLHPGRLVDGLVARGVSFSAAFLFTATLQAVPRLRARAGQILDAQGCRGLRLAGSPWRRIGTLVPLALPLVLSALTEVDDRAVGLEARGMSRASRRTPLDPPADSWPQRVVRWGLAGAVLAAVAARIAA
jgi:energy-coupling factor transport system permease protein